MMKNGIEDFSKRDLINKKDKFLGYLASPKYILDF
jgi:hypothetical protein